MKTIDEFNVNETYIYNGEKYKVIGLMNVPSVIFEKDDGYRLTVGEGGNILNEMKKPASRSLLHGFINYCNSHPGQRFWQALTNWSKYNKIYGHDVQNDNLEDVFYK